MDGGKTQIAEGSNKLECYNQGILLPMLGFFGLFGNLVSIIVLSTPEMAANFFNR